MKGSPEKIKSQPVFRELQTEVIHPGLCTHCGTCVGLSHGTLAMESTAWGPIPSIVPSRQTILSSVAFEACPGRGVNYPDLCNHFFGQQPHSWLVGHYRSVHIGYSLVPDIRRRAASGGAITQTLIYLLEHDLIDGAVVVRQGRPKPWQAQPVIAQSATEIIAASQSVYTPVPVNVVLPEMEAFHGRLAYVGLPDQVASLRRLQQLGHLGAQKVDYVLGPYVGTNTYFGAIESYLRSNGIQSLDEVRELRYREGEWPGYLQIKTRSGQVLRTSKFHYNYLTPFYITRSTLHSVDFANELTDISVGDAWHPRYEAQGEGFSVVMIRSEKGENVLNAMCRKGFLSLETISLDEALTIHGHMLDFKKRGSFIRIGWRKFIGRRVPDYGYHPRSIPLSRKIVEVIISLIFAICSTRLARRLIESIPIRTIGPTFNVLRKTWKNASKPTKRKGLKDLEFNVH